MRFNPGILPKRQSAGLASPWWTAAAIFLFALAVRAVYLLQIKNSAAFTHPIGDGHFYDLWARDIVAGHWLGREAFYQSPFYPYFLAASYALFGINLVGPRLIQVLAGAISCGLLADTGRILFSRRAGLIAGLLAAICPMALYFDGLIQKTAFDLLFSALLLWLLCRSMSSPRWYLLLGAGITLGLLALNRDNALVYAPVVVLWIFWFFRNQSWLERFEKTGMFLAGLALLTLPVCWRNWHRGGDFLVTTQFGPNFYLGNNPRTDGTYVPFRWGHGNAQYEQQDATELAELARLRKLSPSEVSAFWFDQAWDYIRSHPAAWWKLTGRKVLLIWNRHERNDTDALELYLDQSSLLRFLQATWHFGVLAPLALAGIAVTWRDRSRLWLFYLMLLSMSASLSLFVVYSRYRHGLAPFLILFAAAFLSHLITLIAERGFKAIIWPAGWLVLAAIVVNLPLAPADGNASRAMGYYNIGVSQWRQGEDQPAIDSFQKALACNPGDDLSRLYLAILSAKYDRFPEDVTRALAILRQDPSPELRQNGYDLARLLSGKGQTRAAIACYATLLELEPNNAQLNCDMADALLQLGRRQPAIDYYCEALKLQPDLAAARQGLDRALAAEE